MPQLHVSRSLAILVSCTNGKTLPSNGLRVAALPPGAARLDNWHERVQVAAPTRRLRSLYQGQQWQASLSLEQAAKTQRPCADLWVMSAGLGLRSVETKAPSYGASFSKGPDCVGKTLGEQRTWWHGLDRLGDVRNITALLTRYDDVLIVLAPPYRRVLAPELERGPANWVVMSSGKASELGTLSSTGLRAALSCSDAALNLRAAQRFLELSDNLALRSPEALARWEGWAEARRKPRATNGRVLDDEAIRQLIRGWQLTAPGSATSLLRRLRGSGFACEQRRFARLYNAELRGVA